MTQPMGPDPVAEWIIEVCGWQDQARVLLGHLPSQLRVVHDGWWIGIDAFAPYLRVQLCAGRLGEDGTFADVSAVLDGTVNATDREELAQAVQELRKRLDAPQPPNRWAAERYGFPKP
ncbi:hypothetical protein J5Y04_30915 [Kitasatospora sp. RG8]|uniref:hypothetical protein n=1 Tax=Kitasatospora sp. RG8 TaxID=2820815 RepID=UPI001ADEF129|nr:hypothetical protein [Kitasatospora sp. RG8]MBP0453920.1 hypothetical protein [Kitasatospora sp. RG8]